MLLKYFCLLTYISENNLTPERSGNVYVTIVTLSFSVVNGAERAGISDNSFLVYCGLGFYTIEYKYISAGKGLRSGQLCRATSSSQPGNHQTACKSHRTQ